MNWDSFDFGAGVAVGVALFGLLGRMFLKGYLEEKGKSLATREDLGQLTKIVEEVKAQYVRITEEVLQSNRIWLEEIRSRHQLRLAAIDRRLDAHQKAFSLWREIVANLHGPKLTETVMKCQAWWGENCLYLSPNARSAFRSAYDAAFQHASLLQDRSAKDAVERNFALIMEAGAAIVEGAELPSLGAGEYSMLDRTEPGANLALQGTRDEAARP
jgi:hypothetical protein